ncbi:2-succinyl-5-enolpyruvyl-6-hydroxy-3-cyclohexene-1-carboxylate synthase [Conyzicola lurida]|uniref:2-succinyl-5-enolpyruvyl-6-hydroxy-3-cyclohexene-1-carboxylate synthase n=1 Tax=Conyzicola lurida TaxID=1172621 RepID=A0A841AS33_9MICO|nr:2-succinyl-5-enolpyruvyl-6-hydroxy-3-cyclohexene-1-carboxylic-acid synthase [Conyzicola lurida]MBB5844591.1 2-succinyl-5-enolpyruvyl-6-hydroxy-3-cyclohexene-1-carboxylate synthase [Conyzicola lurida]
MTHPRSSSPASLFAVALLDEFVRLGVRDVVLSPGSRSQALALAAAEFEEAGRIRLRVRIDERGAGFLALGLAVETSAPVLVITTSGTAVANLHPAVLEAHHSGVPLIVVTADRPVALRGIGSNQTTEQPGIFGDAVRATLDVMAPTGAPGELAVAATIAGDAMTAAGTSVLTPGPVHLNIAFSEPLSAIVPVPDAREAVTYAAPGLTGDPLPVFQMPGTVVVAGHGAGPVAESTARALGAPLLAEVSSGAHFGPNLVVAYRELLSAIDFGDRVERVIVFGHPTLSREIPALIQRPDVATVVVRSTTADDYNPGHAVATFADAIRVTGEPDNSSAGRAWLGRWVTTSRALLEQHDAPAVELAISSTPADQAAFSRQVMAGLRAPVTRRSLVEAVWRMTWPHDRLVLGASRLIREADRVVPGKKISVHANRGLAGIDGTIATATGIALASQALEGQAAAGITRVLLGDLTLLHDAGSLLFGVGEPRPRLQVIVGNDGGGTIFDSLEVAASAPSGPLDRVMLTAQNVSIESLAAAYGWEYRRIANRGELDAGLTASDAPTIIEVPLAR